MAVLELAAPSRFTHPFLLIRLFLIVFFANMATLILQVVAVRQLAPLVGCSLDTWTAIIGTFLAGICFGNFYGGKLADRSPRERTLFLLLLLAAVGVLSTLGLTALFHRLPFLAFLPLYIRLGLIAAAICFPTSFLLSMISPLSIRLALPNIRSTGRIVGLVYALGTLGSLVGNYLTGFYLLAYLDLDVILLWTGGCLVLLSLLMLGRTDRRAVAETDDFQRPDDRELVSEENGIVPGKGEEHSEPSFQGPATEGVGGESPLVTGARRWSYLAGNVTLGCLLVSLTSFCSMALELAAARLLAPQIGVSIYSFTVIVGVCLAGMALGNFLGGLLADLLPRQLVLSLCLLLAGAAVMSILVATGFLKKPDDFLKGASLHDWRQWFEGLKFLKKMALWASAFFLPLLFLGMVSPQVIRLVLRDVRQSGQVAGRVYAFSCFGALLGVFATGWWLISWVGVNRVIFLCGAVLLGLALLLAVLHGLAQSLALVRDARIVLPIYALTLLGVFGYGGWLLHGKLQEKALESSFTLETNYYAIKVNSIPDDYGNIVQSLELDNLIHSYSIPHDPNYLGYEHEEVQAEIARWVAADDPKAHVLVIGGGGYTLPRFMEKELPRLTVDVVEIDPGVTWIAHEFMGLAEDTSIRSYNMDGRQFVTGWAARQQYSLVIQDAVNDLSVPFHLLTREYNEAIREILTEDGIYLLTVIDDYKHGELMRTAIRTLKQTFPEVHMLEPWDANGQTWNGVNFRSVYVIYASRRPLNLKEIEAVLRFTQKGDMQTMALEPARLQQYIDQGPQIILTDNYAPVDHLMSYLFQHK